MSEKQNGENGGSGQEESQSSEGQAAASQEGYPPSSVRFEGMDAATKSKDESSGERVDLTETDDSDS